MSQIQWMIGLIPDAVLSGLYWAIIAAGITGVLAGWLGKWIPFYGNYVKILQPVGIVLLVLGVWLRGGYDTEMIWRAKVAESEARVVAAEQKSQETNTVIQEKVVEKTKVIKGKTEYITRYIDKIETKEIIKEIPGPERIKEITKDMSAEQKKAYEAEIAQLKQNQDRVQELIKYIESCPVPKEIIDIHNQAADINKAAEGAKK